MKCVDDPELASGICTVTAGMVFLETPTDTTSKGEEDAVANRPRFDGDSQAHSWYRPAGKVQPDRDQLYRTRQVLDRKGFLMSISSSSSPR